MFPSHENNAKLVYLALSLSILVIELGHIVEFMRENIPAWVPHLLLITYPYVLIAFGGFLCGFLYGLVSPGFLDKLRKRLQRRLGQSNGGTEA